MTRRRGTFARPGAAAGGGRVGVGCWWAQGHAGGAGTGGESNSPPVTF